MIAFQCEFCGQIHAELGEQVRELEAKIGRLENHVMQVDRLNQELLNDLKGGRDAGTGTNQEAARSFLSG